MKLNNRLLQVGAFISSFQWLHTAAIELNETIVKIPSNITLRAGVLVAPPFQTLEGEEYSGFGPDLLVRLSELALEDDVLLTFDISNAIKTPAQYASALDLIANDCVTTNETDCDTYDIIVGDYYVSADRALRIQFTPAWLHTRITGVRGEDGKYDSFTAANDARGKVCVPQGTLLPDLIEQKYPNVDRVLCATPPFCIDSTKTGDCDLYADDELLLRYRASQDDTLVLSNEGFGTQYISWPIRFGLDPSIYTLLSRWLYAAVQDESLDKLTAEYFGALVPPPGATGGGGDTTTSAATAAGLVATYLVAMSIVMAVAMSLA